MHWCCLDLDNIRFLRRSSALHVAALIYSRVLAVIILVISAFASIRPSTSRLLHFFFVFASHFRTSRALCFRGSYRCFFLLNFLLWAFIFSSTLVCFPPFILWFVALFSFEAASIVCKRSGCSTSNHWSWEAVEKAVEKAVCRRFR